jgi:hypothetical protein
MRYEVISRFFDRARGVYVDPGTPCPPLDAATAARLVGAKCLVEAPEDEPVLPRLRRTRAPVAIAPQPAESPPAAGE